MLLFPFAINVSSQVLKTLTVVVCVTDVVIQCTMEDKNL